MKLIHLAGFGVAVKNEIEAQLLDYSQLFRTFVFPPPDFGLDSQPQAAEWRRRKTGGFTFPARAMQRLTNRPVLSCLVVIIPNFDFSMKAERSSTFSLTLALSSAFLSVYGSAAFEPVDALEKSELAILFDSDLV